ncbi:MAG: alpha-ribazole phosphatase [Syntrophomonadaceae bacterium]|nr:alpha-ribazole phosphatase [Syntrophomonadaceae bacterium]
MKMILVRHGQTEWNSLQKYQGHTDVQLNELGRQQAYRIGEYLKDHETVEALYASDLSRTRETAEIIGHKVNLPVITDTRLRELLFGIWEGLTFSEVYQQYREEFEYWYDNTSEFRVPEGESFNELLIRSMQALREIADRHTGTVVVATHGGVVRALLYHLQLTKDLWQNSVDPGSMSIFEVNQESIQALQIGLCL